MTKRATFTQADLARAISAAEKAGKVAVWTPAGIVFAPPDAIPHNAPKESGENSCDGLFGVAS